MVYITGDTHGDIGEFSQRMRPYRLSDRDILIITGDFGFDWDNQTIRQWMKFDHPYAVLFCDGNHENFDILGSLELEKRFGDTVGRFDSNTFRLLSGHIYDIQGFRTFVFGGAASIDKAWRIDPDYAWWIYDNVSELDDSNNGRFLWLEENFIKAKLKSALALTASKYTPIEVYSNKREEIQELTYEKMKKDIQDYHLVLEQIDIREVYYNPEYEKAINQKKLEEQAALTLIEVTKQKEELLKQAEIEKNISITKAEAEAKALQIKGQSISSNPRIVELEWINKWNGQLPEYMFGGNQSMILGMPSK